MPGPNRPSKSKSKKGCGCRMCKPHKHGFCAARKHAEVALAKADAVEMRCLAKPSYNYAGAK